MTPQPGQHVKCILRNGALAEGIVESWLVDEVQLKSLDGESILIITRPTEDIMLIKILLEIPKENEEQLEVHSIDEEIKSDLKEKVELATEAMDPTNIESIKTLAELKIELAKQERKIIAEKLREHRPSAYAPSTTPYHYPSVVDKQMSAYKPARIPNGFTRPSKKQSSK
jgi:hypothetical protein